MTTSLVPTTQPVADFATRQELARQACLAAGIEWPGTILPPGTALYKEGVESLKAYREGWKRLPVAGEVIGLVEAALEAEKRQDFPEDVRNLRFRPQDGRLVRVANLDNERMVGLGYGQHTLRQLVQQIDPLDDAPRGFSSALLYLDDQERAEILNKRIAKMGGETAITLRTKLPHEGTRIARAALSKIYGSVTDHDIARAVGAVLKGDTKGKLDYKPGDQRSRFEVIWPSEIPIETFVVGDVHYACLSITNSETGEGSIRIASAVIRARCANLTLSVGDGTEVILRHVGDPVAIMRKLVTAINLAIRDIEPLLDVIQQSARIRVEVLEPGKFFESVARRYALPAASAKHWLDTWQEKYQQESQSVFSLTAAISDATKKAGDWTEGAEWERIASQVQARAVEVVKAGTPHAMALAKALAAN